MFGRVLAVNWNEFRLLLRTRYRICEWLSKTMLFITILRCCMLYFTFSKSNKYMYVYMYKHISHSFGKKHYCEIIVDAWRTAQLEFLLSCGRLCITLGHNIPSTYIHCGNYQHFGREFPYWIGWVRASQISLTIFLFDVTTDTSVLLRLLGYKYLNKHTRR